MMLTMLVVMGLVSVAIFYAGWVTVVASIQILSNEYVDEVKEQIKRTLSDVTVATVNTVPLIEETLDRPEKLYDIMERMVHQNPRVRSCGISFVADYYPKKGHWFCPYAVRGANDTIAVKTIGDSEHDYLNSEWFTQAIAAEEALWSKPFLDGVDKRTPLVSRLFPIRNKQGKTVAVLGVDILLDHLIENVSLFGSKDDGETWSAEKEAYIFVIDSCGTYIAHPDLKRLVKGNYFTYANTSPDTLDNHIGRRMAGGASGYFFDDSPPLIIEGENVSIDYRPVTEANWSVALVIPTNYVNVVGYILGGILLTLVAIGILVVFFVGRSSIKKAVKPLRQLAASADEVAKGHFDTPLPNIKHKDEIRQLRDSFESMQRSLTEYIEELKTTTAQKASMESELKVAHDIQMSMLPKTFPPFPDREDVDVYGTLKPAKEVGGDLFDFYIRDEKLIFCIGDVSGKGVPASLFMAMARSLFRNISAHTTEPHRIAYTLNEALSEGNENNMFVTAFIGVLDLGTGLLKYCNAGHNPPLIIGRDVCVLDCSPNVALGLMGGMDFVTQKIQFEPQTMIFLFTDGLNEAEDVYHAQFGDDRILRQAEASLAKGKTQPAEIVNQMLEAVHAFVGEAEQSDDLTMLAIKYN